MFVSVVGAIAAGKSTLIKQLDGPNCISVFEATAKWKESGILESFYADPEKFAFLFQLSVFNDYVDSVQFGLEKVTNNQTLIVERSIYCQPLFWSMQPKKDHEDPIYFAIWKKWQQLIPEPSHFIFLDVEEDKVDVLLERIKQRGRAGEESVSTEYERQLILKHKEFYTKKRFGEKLIILNAMDSVETNVAKIKKQLKI